MIMIILIFSRSVGRAASASASATVAARAEPQALRAAAAAGVAAACAQQKQQRLPAAPRRLLAADGAQHVEAEAAGSHSPRAEHATAGPPAATDPTVASGRRSPQRLQWTSVSGPLPICTTHRYTRIIHLFDSTATHFTGTDAFEKMKHSMYVQERE